MRTGAGKPAPERIHYSSSNARRWNTGAHHLAWGGNFLPRRKRAIDGGMGCAGDEFAMARRRPDFIFLDRQFAAREYEARHPPYFDALEDVVINDGLLPGSGNRLTPLR